jgi:uncharacterized membrane protein YphA (DoxX/SURF4 family)
MSTTTTNAIEIAPTRARTVALWIAQLAVAGILGMAAFAKLFNFTAEGSKPLADALGIGRGAVAGIGIVELAAVILILLPWRRAVGALLAVGTMMGALLSHAAVIGWSGNPGEMWPMALVVLVAASVVLVMRRRELTGRA